MAGVSTVCEECEGKRFQAAVLDYHLAGRDISQVLGMSVTEALEFFAQGKLGSRPPIGSYRGWLTSDWGYLTLGQPLTTLSGGERQRIKLASQMGDPGTSTFWTSRRPVCISPTSTSCSGCWIDWWTTEVRDRDRTSPGRHGSCRLDHRSGTGRRGDGGRVVFEGHRPSWWRREER